MSQLNEGGKLSEVGKPGGKKTAKSATRRRVRQ
jgi:hypothetical protein